jgi:hypothetical protein
VIVMAVTSLAPPARPQASDPPSPSALVTATSWVAAALALPTAAAGLFWRGGDGPSSVTTARGQMVELYGHGLYQYDSIFTAGAARGTDAVVILLGLPLLVVTTLRLRRRSARSGLLHAGALLLFVYVYGSASLGTVSHNPMFPAYVAVFSASLFGFIAALMAVDRAAFAGPLPRRGPAVFLFVSAALTLLVWTQPEVAALLDATVPERLGTASTDVTYALDVGIIVPAAVVAGVLILRRSPLGYIVAVPLLVLEVLLAPLIAAQTVSQVETGVSFTVAEMIGPLAGFLTLAAVAAWFLVAVARRTGRPPGGRLGGLR